jgi:hypothetical protein
MQAGQYRFEIIDKGDNDRQIATAVNDADGKIVFSNLHLEEARTYHLALREINDGTQSSVLYDTTSYNIDVEVRNDSNGLYAVVVSNITDGFRFVNRRTYTLPETGGCGTIIYFLLGTALISGSFILPAVCRRKERS